MPTAQEIYSYIRVIYKRTKMQPECIVMTLAYIERLLKSQRVQMTIHTWRRITLGALIISDKVFEDYAVWNADFLSLFPQSNIQDLNSIERTLLNCMSFDTNIKASQYIQYYFALKELSRNADSLPSAGFVFVVCFFVCVFVFFLFFFFFLKSTFKSTSKRNGIKIKRLWEKKTRGTRKKKWKQKIVKEFQWNNQQLCA